jgi:hypothetical protein
MTSEARLLLLSNSYESCEYTIITAKLSTDAGGISQRVMIELPSPALSSDFAQSNERLGDLHAMPTVEAPLPKELCLIDIADKDDDQGTKKYPSASILNAIPSSATPFIGDKRVNNDDSLLRQHSNAPSTPSLMDRKKPRAQTFLHQKGTGAGPNIAISK